MKLPKYDLVEHSSGAHKDHWCIKIQSGDYKGLIYQYDTVNIEEDKGGDGAVLHFSTIVVEKPEKLNLTKEKDQSILGEVLVNIISEQLDSVKDTDENGTPNSKKSLN